MKDTILDKSGEGGSTSTNTTPVREKSGEHGGGSSSTKPDQKKVTDDDEKSDESRSFTQIECDTEKSEQQSRIDLINAQVTYIM